jgi:Domain of unknown function (DUF4136)
MVVKNESCAYRCLFFESSLLCVRNPKMSNKVMMIVIATLGLGGCAASIPPVEVTRFHLGQPVAAGTVMIEPAAEVDAKSLEFGTYAAAVARQLTSIGLNEARAEPGTYSAVVGYTRTSRVAEAKRSPITIGIGGGTGGGGLGIGLGTSFGIGKAKAKQTIITQLSVQIKRRADQNVIWEGRAMTEAPEGAPAAQPGLAADKLANALFKGFPGTSGATITVP